MTETFMLSAAGAAEPVSRPTRTPTYRYVLADLLTDQTLCQLPLTGVTFGRRISRPEQLSGTLACPNTDRVRLAKLVHANCGRTALYVYRDGQVWWGGILWTAAPAQDERGTITVAVGASTFDSYPHRRLLAQDVTYTQTDQGIILPDLWRRVQADPAGDIGVVAADQPDGTLRDRTYRVTDGAFVGTLIEQLGDVEDGPEHAVNVYAETSGQRVKSLTVAPRIGSVDPTFTFTRARYGAGGRVLAWAEPADAAVGGTTFRTRGAPQDGNAGADQQPLMSDEFRSQTLLDQGWPLLDHVEDHTEVILLSTLNGYARAARKRLAGGRRTYAYTVSVAGTGWNPNRLGDTVRLMLSDMWHTPPVTLPVRPVAVQVAAAERGQPERVEMLFAEEEGD